MSRANSLKKAVRQIIEHTERVLDEQNEQLARQEGALASLPLPRICLPSDDEEEEGQSSSLAKVWRHLEGHGNFFLTLLVLLFLV